MWALWLLYERICHLSERNWHLYDRKGHLDGRNWHLDWRKGHLYERKEHLYERKGHLNCDLFNVLYGFALGIATKILLR